MFYDSVCVLEGSTWIVDLVPSSLLVSECDNFEKLIESRDVIDDITNRAP